MNIQGDDRTDIGLTGRSKGTQGTPPPGAITSSRVVCRGHVLEQTAQGCFSVFQPKKRADRGALFNKAA